MTLPARTAWPSRAIPGPPERRGERFPSVEQAWFWTMGALAARRDGTGRGIQGIPRPCDPDDIVKVLDTLYRQRRIDLAHARILRIWGERQTCPDAAYAAERGDAKLWREAMARLEFPLRAKGIVF